MLIPKGIVLLIVKDPNNAGKYEEYLKDTIELKPVTSIHDAYQLCLQQYYDLILIDLKLSLGLGRLQLERLNSLSDAPPSLKIRPRENEVEVILQEQRAVEELKTFLQKFFSRLEEQKSSVIDLRKYVRFKSILRVTIQREQDPEPIKANTLDISMGGLFITSIYIFNKEDTFNILIYDIIDKPIMTTSQAAWYRPWEIPHQLPGVGANFISFSREEDRYNLSEYIQKTFGKK